MRGQRVLYGEHVKVWWRRQEKLPAAQRTTDPVHFLHIGKTGGTAIKAALKAHPPDVTLHVHPHRFRLANVPRGERVFFFVRDPLSRFVSAFYSRKRKGLPRYYFEWSKGEAEAFAAFETPDALASALASPDKKLRKRARVAMRQIRHLQSSYLDWIGSERALLARLDDVLLIGLQEELGTDFQLLKRLLGLPPAASLPTDDRIAHRNPAGADKRLSAEAEANLRAWYAKDIAIYDLCKRLREERFGIAATGAAGRMES